MDSDSYRCEQIKEEGTKESSDGPKQEGISGNLKSNGRNVFSAAGIRRAFSNYNETNKFFLDYGLLFLLPFGTILYTIFFIFS